MADDSESDYGEDDYGESYYSYDPVWLFESQSVISFYTSAIFVSGPVQFSANVQIPFYASAVTTVVYSFSNDIHIPIYVESDEYLGPFWNPDVPYNGLWVPDVPVSGAWISATESKGPWIPIGPDMRPNDG